MYIIFEDFGKKRVNLKELVDMNELLLGTFKHKKEIYYGIMDKNFKVLVPFSTREIVDFVYTFDRNNCFFTFIDNENNYNSIHLSRLKEDNLFYIRADIKGTSISNSRLIKTTKENYWFIESTTDNITEICLYDVKKGKILTPLLSDISFEEEKGRVLAFIEKKLYAKIDNEQVPLISLVSFIDKEGKYLTQFYDTENEQYYDSIIYNFDSNFKGVNRLFESITAREKQIFLEKQNRVNNDIIEMFNNLYTEEEIQSGKQKAKIIKFPSEVTNDKK